MIQWLGLSLTTFLLFDPKAIRQQDKLIVRRLGFCWLRKISHNSLILFSLPWVLFHFQSFTNFHFFTFWSHFKLGTSRGSYIEVFSKVTWSIPFSLLAKIMNFSGFLYYVHEMKLLGIDSCFMKVVHESLVSMLGFVISIFHELVRISWER